MTTYNVTVAIGKTYISESITVDTDLFPEDEINFAENSLLDKWTDLFKCDIVELADEVTSFTVKDTDEQ